MVALLLLATIAYVICLILTGDPFLFIMLVPCMAGAAFCLCLILIRSRIVRIVVLSGSLWVVGFGGLLNWYWLPEMTHPISILGNAGLVVFTLLVARSVVEAVGRRRVVAGVLVFLMFLGGLKLIASVECETTGSTSMAAIESLPYLSYVAENKSEEKNGVVIHDRGLACEGLNLYRSFSTPAAHLLDMEGSVLHTWQPGRSYPARWHYETLAENGDLLVCIRDVALLRLDWESRIKWERGIRTHHDIALAENNDIYTLTRKDELVSLSGFPLPIANDYLVTLSPDGDIEGELSMYSIFSEYLTTDTIFRIYAWAFDPRNLWCIFKSKMDFGFVLESGSAYDVFHTNTVTVIDRDIPGLCRKNDVLLSSPKLNLIGILDLDEMQLLWSWGPGILEIQHHPTLLENGNIMVFDNGGVVRDYSRVLELDPFTKEIVWQYEADPPTSFYSNWGGGGPTIAEREYLDHRQYSRACLRGHPGGGSRLGLLQPGEG